MKTFMRKNLAASLSCAMLGGVCLVFAPVPAGAEYIVNNLVSDLPGLAPVTDPNLVNPWGLASSSSSPIWVSDNGTGVSTLYNGAGQPFPVGSPLVVTIPPPPGGSPPSSPTGVVFNTGTSFGGARFIFGNLGWDDRGLDERHLRGHVGSHGCSS